MPAKPTKTKLPVPINQSKPVARRRRIKEPAPPAGPVAAFVRGFIDRIGEMARARGPYEAFVTVLTMTGIAAVLYGKDSWPIVIVAPLIARFVQRSWPCRWPR